MSAILTKAEWEKLRRESELAVLDRIDQRHVLLRYQQKTVGLLDDTALTPVLFVEKSRRIGLTWGLGAYAALRAGRAREAGGMDVMYISYSQEMTREFIDAVAMWARAFNQAALSVDEFLFDDSDTEGERSIQAFRIRFASGFEVVGLSSAPRTLRGKQGVVIIDEAAFVDSLKELLKAALAFLMWGGQVVVCSTHNGTDNEFNLQIQDILGGRSKYAHLKIDFDEALLDGLYKRICLVSGRKWSPEAEAQWRDEIIAFYGDGADEELFCVPTAGTGAWLTAPLIEARMTLEPEDAPIIRIELPDDYLQRPELERRHLMAPYAEAIRAALGRLNPKWMHAFGYDPARLRDPAVAHLLAIDNVLRRRSALTVEMRRVPFQEQFAIVSDMLGAPRLIGAAIDGTGMGMQIAEDLGRRFGLREDADGTGLVWPIRLNPPWYNEHFPPLKTAFEDGSILLARDADHLGDLRLVKIVRGVPQVPAERTDQKTEEGASKKKRHGDFSVALGLAHFASRMQWHEFGYLAATPRQPSEPGPADRMSDYPDDSDDYLTAGDDDFSGPLGARIRGGI